MAKVKEDFVNQVRKYKGIPFHHQGRNRTKGLDCAGLLIVSLEDLGFNPVDNTVYKRSPDHNMLLDIVRKNSRVVESSEPEHGDVLVFRIGKYPQHLAVFTNKNTLIHSLLNKGVVEQKYNNSWRKRLQGVYSIV